MMMKTYRFKLYADKDNQYIHDRINTASAIYNHCVALHRRYYRLFKKHLSRFALQRHLTKLKQRPRWQSWSCVGSQAIQNITERIDRGYKVFFTLIKKRKRGEKVRRVAPPSFRSRHKYRSFTLKQAGYKLLGGNQVRIGDKIFKFFKSREIVGKIKTLTVKRDNLGDIYLYFACEVIQPVVKVRSGKTVGFDFSLKSFLIAEDKQDDVKSPMFFKRNSKIIKQRHRKLSRKKRGSHHRQQARRDLARAYRKATNQREDFQWKLAHELCDKYAVICIEDLNMRWMQMLHGRRVLDYGFAELVDKLEYIASQTGTQVVKVDRFFASSQLCSVCGFKNSDVKDLRIREWTCPSCGAHHDRDRNAARNIKLAGTSAIRRDAVSLASDGEPRRLYPRIPRL